MGNEILEAASEKRGRPPKFHPEMLKYLRQSTHGVESTRQLQSIHLAYMVMQEIIPAFGGDNGNEDKEGFGGDPRLDFLVQRHGQTMKTSILAELGRIKDERPEVFWDAVEWVLDEQPKTKAAVPVLRQVRTGQSRPAGTVLSLTNHVMKAISAYGQTHEITDKQVTEALKLAQHWVEDSEAASEKDEGDQ